MTQNSESRSLAIPLLAVALSLTAANDAFARGGHASHASHSTHVSHSSHAARSGAFGAASRSFVPKSVSRFGTGIGNRIPESFRSVDRIRTVAWDQSQQFQSNMMTWMLLSSHSHHHGSSVSLSENQPGKIADFGTVAADALDAMCSARVDFALGLSEAKNVQDAKTQPDVAGRLKDLERIATTGRCHDLAKEAKDHGIALAKSGDVTVRDFIQAAQIAIDTNSSIETLRADGKAKILALGYDRQTASDLSNIAIADGITHSLPVKQVGADLFQTSMEKGFSAALVSGWFDDHSKLRPIFVDLLNKSRHDPNLVPARDEIFIDGAKTVSAMVGDRAEFPDDLAEMDWLSDRLWKDLAAARARGRAERDADLAGKADQSSSSPSP